MSDGDGLTWYIRAHLNGWEFLMNDSKLLFLSVASGVLSRAEIGTLYVRNGTGRLFELSALGALDWYFGVENWVSVHC